MYHHRRPTAAVFFTGLSFLLLILVLSITMSSSRRAAADEPATLFLPAITRPAALATKAFGSDFNQVVGIADPGDGRLFITERDGRIKILHPDGKITTFLDIADRVTTDGAELGMFALAFDPGYAQPESPGKGLFYVTYTGKKDAKVYTFVSRFRVTADPDIADPLSEAYLVRLEQQRPVHKGGGLDFDVTNRLLYVGFGEDWQRGLSQEPGSLKGKVVMLDLSKVPADATGDQTGSVAPVVWAMGFRNPFRIDVDAETGSIYVGDVGENHWEEVNIVSLAAPGGNFGWPCMEAADVMPDAATRPECASLLKFTLPTFAYEHKEERCAIIGGYIQRRGDERVGRYIFGDMCSRDIFVMAPFASGWTAWVAGKLPTWDPISGFGMDSQGNIYAGTLAASESIYRLELP